MATYRVVVKGIAHKEHIKETSIKLASQLSATPQQIEKVISSSHFVLARNIPLSAAENYENILRDHNVYSSIEDESVLLPIEVPKEEYKQSYIESNEDDNIANRIADSENTSAIIWLIIGIIQLFTVYLIIAGVWNIFVAVGRFKLVKRIRLRENSVINEFESKSSIIITGIVNLIFGGIIGVVMVFFDLSIRDRVLSNRKIFNKNAPDHPSDWTSDSSVPREGNQSFAAAARHETHHGVAYAIHGDGMVIAIVKGKPMTWANEAGFKAWAEKQAVAS